MLSEPPFNVPNWQRWVYLQSLASLLKAGRGQNPFYATLLDSRTYQGGWLPGSDRLPSRTISWDKHLIPQCNPLVYTAWVSLQAAIPNEHILIDWKFQRGFSGVWSGTASLRGSILKPSSQIHIWTHMRLIKLKFAPQAFKWGQLKKSKHTTISAPPLLFEVICITLRILSWTRIFSTEPWKFL